MLRTMLFRCVVPAILTVSMFPAAVYSQTQDSQSVAEAARRAREKKKDAAKPVKVITDETLDVKKGDIQSAVAEEPKMPGAPEAQPQTAAAAPAATNASASDKDEKLKKEIADLKEQIKQALIDLDLLQRENRLDNEAFYSKPDYAGDKAGKQKLDDEKQQISDKREEIDRLKAKLADLQKALGEPSSENSQP